jgi:hypothetical protein
MVRSRPHVTPLSIHSHTGSALSSQLSSVFNISDYPTTDMYVADRCEHFPMLHIRPAVVEDADDLMPIFSQYSAEMHKEYGESVALNIEVVRNSNLGT